MTNNLRKKDQWEESWNGVKIPAIVQPAHDILQNLRRYLPAAEKELSLIEIGCSPGRWMAFFSKAFEYRVSGVEYAEDAALLTRKNLQAQKIEAQIFVEDFLTWSNEDGCYDVVFSAGFIEHFQDLNMVVGKICGLSRRFVVTMVPNLKGINGMIRKVFNRKGFYEHVCIETETLAALHEASGFRTLFCGYVGGIQFVPPGDGSRFYKKHPIVAKLIYLPVIFFNKLVRKVSSIIKKTPNSLIFSNSIMYIGERK